MGLISTCITAVVLCGKNRKGVKEKQGEWLGVITVMRVGDEMLVVWTWVVKVTIE